MMEVQEDEEEAPDKRQGYTYNHTHPHTASQHKQDPTEPSLRRSTRSRKPPTTPTDQCRWRQSQEQGSFCPRSCQGHQSAPCANQLPTWERETWAHLKHTPGLVSNTRPLTAAHPIPKGTLFTQFGGHTLQKQTHPLAYNAFMALRQTINLEPGHERLQYIVEAEEEPYWIPPNDKPLINRSSTSTQLKQLLTTTPPAAGLGQYANHSCCGKCINAEIAPMVILREDKTGKEWRDLQGVALRATKDIHTEEEIFISYGEIATWKKVFTCTCCKCSGRCDPQPPPITAHCTWIMRIRNSHNPSPEVAYREIEANLKRDHATLFHEAARPGKQPRPSCGTKPQEICIQQATNPRSFSSLAIRETAPLAPQIKAFLQLPRSASIFLSCRGSLLPGDATPASLNRAAEEVVTVHQNELKTLWKDTTTVCDLPLLRAFGTDDMIGGHEINQVMRWALWGNTQEWGLSPHRLTNVHTFCTFAWMRLESVYGKFIVDNDWTSFRQTLREIPELNKPTAASIVCFPINIPNLHWYLGTLLLHENAVLLLDSLQSCTTTSRHQRAADAIWAWKHAIWDDRDTLDPAPSLQPLTPTREAQLTDALRADPPRSPTKLPTKSSAVWKSTQQNDSTSCGIFVIARLIAITRGWPAESAIAATLPIQQMRAWLMYVVISLTERAPLGACARCKEIKILAVTHAGATVCIKCLNNTPTLDAHHTRDEGTPTPTAQPRPAILQTAIHRQDHQDPPTSPPFPVDEDDKGPSPIHSETRNPSLQHHHTQLGRQLRPKDHSAAARRAGKRPRTRTTIENRSWNQCPDCG
jgi:hypothetical protein